MRPDEHKKKKNNLYKKKHGIIDKSKDPQGHKDVKGQSKKTGKINFKLSSGENNQKTDDVKTKDLETRLSSDSDESSDDDLKTTKPSFQKRKVVSNWDRYDLPPDEESTKTKGENFSRLLQVAGSSTSQFRFKEEEEWTSPEQTELSLDLQDLSSSISCFPLYEVLRLDKDLLSVEQIAEYDRLSSENQKKYQQNSNSVNSVNPVHIDRKRDNSKNSTEKQASKQREKLCIESNALDELLDAVVLEETGVHRLHTELLPDKSNTGRLTTLEEDLDDLLSSDNHKENKYIQQDISSSVHTAKTTQDENLEDWLDSVLDN